MMIKSVPRITAKSVTVIDANGIARSIPVSLTPHRFYLTQATKRAILATGFLIRYGEDLASNWSFINDILEYIRQKVLLEIRGGGQ